MAVVERVLVDQAVDFARGHPGPQIRPDKIHRFGVEPPRLAQPDPFFLFDLLPFASSHQHRISRPLRSGNRPLWAAAGAP